MTEDAWSDPLVSVRRERWEIIAVAGWVIRCDGDVGRCDSNVRTKNLMR
jgi:hypothetical protein